MINFGDVTKENMKEHNSNQPQIHDHPNVNNWRHKIWKNKFNI